jgi:uncharacterized lipoprotein YddW (UPF0748 family)
MDRGIFMIATEHHAASFWFFTALATLCLHAAEPLPLNWEALRLVGGHGKVVRQEDRLTLTRETDASSTVVAVLPNIAAAGDSAYLLRTKVRLLSDDGEASFSVVARTSDKRWIRDWKSPCFSKGTVQDVVMPLCTNADTAALELTFSVERGAAEFAAVSLTPTSFLADDGRRLPDMEMWLNMDYLDNVEYCSNLGLENYDEPAIVAYFATCKRRNVTGVLWRVSALGNFVYPTKVGTIFPQVIDGQEFTEGEKRMAGNLERFDPLAVAIREAKRNGVQLYIWMTLSDEAYNDQSRGMTHFSQFQKEHPETVQLNRKGEPLYGTMCYSEPAARKYRLDIIRELLAYGADGLYLCTRSHSFSFGEDKGDEYGFNPTIVKQYKERYGVDILTEDFDIQKWRELKAEGLDQLIREAADLVHAAGQKLMFGTSFWGLSDSLTGNWGKMPVDVKKYLRNGWVDSVVSGQFHVGPFFASIQQAAFAQAARPEQKLYFWAQIYDYGQKRTHTSQELLEQAAFFRFLGANGGMYHESVNLEERDNPEILWTPLEQFYRKY